MFDESTEEKLKTRIDRIAKSLCEDYPDVEDVGPLEQLYAIESSLKGTRGANRDLHRIIDELQDRLGLSDDDLYELWEEEVKSPPKPYENLDDQGKPL